MELKRVRLYNFSSYAGEANFDFSTSKEQNIILIGGNNGAGKTSLFTAIKLALYGPLCFRYQGKNAQYSARIKELINHDAFTESEVRTYVEVEVVLPIGQSYSTYIVHREWNYAGQRVHEKYWVSDGSGPLSARDRDYFENYLFTIIPPNMFEFFFFDGEEISNFFSDSAYNAYIKKAVLTLCGYDTFSLIKKFCDTYVGGESSDVEYNHLLEELSTKEESLKALDAAIVLTESALQELNHKKTAASDEKESLEVQFKKSGGLSKNVRDSLNNKMLQHDRTKNEYSKKVRDFVEGMMPFYITYSLSQGIGEQLSREDQMRQYLASIQQLSVVMLRNAISGIDAVPPDQIEALSQHLYDRIAVALCPEEAPDEFHFIHDLSNEQRTQVSSMLTELHNFDPNDILQAITAKKDAAEKYEEAARKLRESLPSIDANTFFEKFSYLSKQITEYENSITAAQEQLNRLNADKPGLEKTIETLRVQIQAEAKNQTAYRYTTRISSMMDGLISDVVQEKFKQIEQMTLQMFHEITHKDNFIDLLELDDSFNILIYKKQKYTAEELYTLAEHVGIDELRTRLGNTGMSILLDWFHSTSSRSLRKSMKKYFSKESIYSQTRQVFDLYKKVEISQLSKGEKQVFLLSLYWAIIKSSGQNIPFIIDTPFARIDMEHREQLAQLFFTSVSSQVIILSTDEEVVGIYHDRIRSKTAHEYLLTNNEITGHTSVCPGYFAKEGSR